MMQTADSQDAVLWSVVVVEEEGRGQEAVEVGGDRGASNLDACMHAHTPTHTHTHKHVIT